MTMTLTLPVLLTCLAMVGGLLMLSHRFGTWAGEIQSMLKNHEEHILSLRADRHNHAERLHVLENVVEMTDLEQRAADKIRHRRTEDNVE